MRFDLLLSDKLYIFVIGYTFIFLYVCFLKKRTYSTLKDALLVLVLWYFSTSFFHAHRFVWLVLFISLAVTEDRRFFRLFLIQAVCLFVYTFQWGRDFAGYLFAPVNPVFMMGLPGPYEVIDRFYPADFFIGIVRSVFTAVSVWIIYEVYKKYRIYGKSLI